MQLPSEILREALAFLKRSEIDNALTVNRGFYHLIDSHFQAEPRRPFTKMCIRADHNSRNHYFVGGDSYGKLAEKRTSFKGALGHLPHLLKASHTSVLCVNFLCHKDETVDPIQWQKIAEALRFASIAEIKLYRLDLSNVSPVHFELLAGVHNLEMLELVGCKLSSKLLTNDFLRSLTVNGVTSVSVKCSPVDNSRFLVDGDALLDFCFPSEERLLHKPRTIYFAGAQIGELFSAALIQRSHSSKLTGPLNATFTGDVRQQNLQDYQQFLAMDHVHQFVGLGRRNRDHRTYRIRHGAAELTLALGFRRSLTLRRKVDTQL